MTTLCFKKRGVELFAITSSINCRLKKLLHLFCRRFTADSNGEKCSKSVNSWWSYCKKL